MTVEMDLKIRAMAEGDAEAVAALTQQLGYQRSAEEIRAWMRDAAARKSEQFAFVACVDGEVAGWVEVNIQMRLQSAPFAMIGGLVVRDSARGRGIGRQLCQRAEAWAWEQRVGKVRVTSRSTREGAHRFYLRDGYEQVKTSLVFEKKRGEQHAESFMNRRKFLASGVAAASAVAIHSSAVGEPMAQTGTARVGLDLNRHRFGVNYTPSHNWWFCWNDWNAAPIQRDLDAIAALGADHLRIMLVWPFFQPNPKWVSTAHLERLDQLLTLMGQRNLDALVTVFTGQLSGWYFLPPFNRLSNGFYTTELMADAQNRFVSALARTMKPHANIIGFDFGNELNTCWQAPTQAGDAWMARMFALMNEALPDKVHVNGVDHHPWFENDTFSPQALAAARFPVMHCYPWWTGALQYGGAMDPPSVKLLAAMAALIRSYAGTERKPVWAGEFNTCIEALPEKGQAEWLEKAVTAAIGEGVSWFSYWDSHDVDRKFAFNPLEYSLGLLTNDGRVKEQGRVFKQLAEAYRGKAVAYPAGSAPQPPQDRTIAGTWGWINDWLGWKPKNA